MLENQNIIIFALPRWDGQYESTSFNIARELAKNNRVLYVDNPFTLKDFIKNFKSHQIKKRMDKFSPSSDGIIQYDENGIELSILVTPPIVPMNFLPQGIIYNTVSNFNHWIVGKRIQRAIETLQFKNYIYINSWNFHYPNINRYVEPVLQVYHCVDSMIKPFNLKHGPYLEKHLVKKSDLVISTAKALQENHSECNPFSYYVPNAADFQLCSRALHEETEIPDVLKTCKKPIIGYFGNIERRIDYELIAPVIKRNRDWTFAFIGPVDYTYFPEELKNNDNVILTGAQPFSMLPNFLKGFDIAIIPFKVDKVSNTIYPLKLFEYLGAGKPVVTTPFNTSLIKELEHDIYIATTATKFESAITTALNNNSEDLINRRLEVAKNNTWEVRGNEFADLLKKWLDTKSDKAEAQTESYEEVQVNQR